MKVMIEIDLPEGQAVPTQWDIVKLTSPDWIADWWHTSDVESCLRTEMTDEECREVLKRVKDNHDANVGINWDVIRDHADDVLDEREEVLE